MTEEAILKIINRMSIDLSVDYGEPFRESSTVASREFDSTDLDIYPSHVKGIYADTYVIGGFKFTVTETDHHDGYDLKFECEDPDITVEALSVHLFDGEFRCKEFAINTEPNNFEQLYMMLRLAGLELDMD